MEMAPSSSYWVKRLQDVAVKAATNRNRRLEDMYSSLAEHYRLMARLSEPGRIAERSTKSQMGASISRLCCCAQDLPK